jgi:H+/Cl- antiporter ClcA
VTGWVLIQIATQIFPFFEIPNWAVRLVILLLLLGFPVALILAWAFELTPEGIKRAEEAAPNERFTIRKSRGFVAFVTVLAALGLGLLLFRSARPKFPGSPAGGIPANSITVLPVD